MRSFNNGIQLNTTMLRVKYSVQLTPACLHRFGHLIFADVTFLHGIFELPRQDTLDGDGIDIEGSQCG